MNNHAAMVGPGSAPHVEFQLVEHHLEPRIPIDMDVQLITEVPVHAHRPGKEIGVHHPLPFVAIGIAIFHLHGLRVDGAVGEELYLLREVSRHAVSPAQKPLGLLGDPLVGKTAGDRLSIGDEIEAEG
jgi:hypothetical protein